MMNIDHFTDLPQDMQTALLDYIALNYHSRKSINKSHSAAGLKQHFSSSYEHQDYHVTNQCLAEAMEKAGFKKVRTSETVPNWYFNADVHKKLKP